MPSQRLQITLADVALLLIGVACGFWNIRATGILSEGSLPPPMYALLLLDNFVCGLSFVGPMVVALHWISAPRAEKAAGEMCLLLIGAVNLGVVMAARILGNTGLAVLLSFLFFRYHFGWLILCILSLYVLSTTARARDWSWPHVFGLLVLIGQTIGAIGFRLAPIDTVIDV